MLPFEPETVEALSKRYISAIAKSYDIVQYLQNDGPEQNRENLFDFEDGWRLIITIDEAKWGSRSGRILHVSGSNHKTNPRTDIETVLSHFRKISNHCGEATLKFNTKVASHLMFPLSDSPDFLKSAGNSDWQEVLQKLKLT